MEVRPLEETPGCAPAPRDGTRRRGGGVSCRFQTTAILPEKADLHEGCRGPREAGEPSSGCLLRFDDTAT